MDGGYRVGQWAGWEGVGGRQRSGIYVVRGANNGLRFLRLCMHVILI